MSCWPSNGDRHRPSPRLPPSPNDEHPIGAHGKEGALIFAGIVDTDVGIRPFGYVTSMVVTIGLWLTLAPAIGAVVRPPGKSPSQKGQQAAGELWEAR